MPAKVWVPLVMIIGGVCWLAFSNLSKANYFYKVNELPAMGDAVYQNNLRVKGRIVPGTIVKEPKPILFTIHEEDVELKVRYVGTEPLPDLFKDRAEAVVDGKMAADGVFEATHLQAKCASKYEAKAPDASEGQAETIKSGY
ncbi:MAG: cytochrome c maturation protein CcmE [Acidobacteriota bacterium]|nr:cytochrome c maturation protein CcmE [Acidobacteriota bacterium]